MRVCVTVLERVLRRGGAGRGDRPSSGGRRVVQTPQGVTAMVVAEVVYGFFPLYWAALANISSMNVMLYRIVTAAVVMVLFMLATRRWPRFVASVKALWARPKVFAAAVAAAVLVTIDWVVYIYLVSIGHTSEASAANFLMPLINMLLALVFLRERTTGLGIVSMLVALAGGVLYVMDTGAFPGLAMLMTFSYSGYCLIKRFVPLDPFESLTFETGVLTPFAFVALAVQPRFGVPAGGTVVGLVAAGRMRHPDGDSAGADLVRGQACHVHHGEFQPVHHADDPVGAGHCGAGRAGAGQPVHLVHGDLAGAGDLLLRRAASASPPLDVGMIRDGMPLDRVILREGIWHGRK